MSSWPKPKIFAVSDGRAGIARQAIALANAIGDKIAIDLQVQTLNPDGPQIMLPPTMWHDPMGALPKEQAAIFKDPMPDIWIANGRRSIAYSLWVKKRHKKTLVVQIQDPKIATNNFDFVVAPMHDKVIGENVYETLGGLVYYTDAQISAAKAQFPNFASDENKTGHLEHALVILGGNSKTHLFGAAQADNLLRDLSAKKLENIGFWITASRRTPPAIADKFRRFANANGHYFFESEEKDGANPYLAWLALADYAIITEDSANMLSDAAFFGLPIHLVRLSGKSRKFETLHKSFIDAGAALWFRGELQCLNYELPKYVENAADAIVKTWQNRQVQG